MQNRAGRSGRSRARNPSRRFLGCSDLARDVGWSLDPRLIRWERQLRRWLAAPPGSPRGIGGGQQLAEGAPSRGHLAHAHLIYQGDRNHVTDYLTGLGWDVTARSVDEAHSDNGFQYPDDELSRAWTQLKYVRAVLSQKR